MEDSSARLWRLRVAPVGPLTPYLDPFAEALLAQGYRQHLIGRQIRTVSYFSAWLDAEDVEFVAITDAHAQRFLETRYSTDTDQRRSRSQGSPSTIRRLLTWLRQQGLLEPERRAIEATPISIALEAFARYLVTDCALATLTSKQYCPVVGLFLRGRFGDAPLDLQAISADDIVSFVMKEAARLSPARSRVTTTALRSYCRYLRASGSTCIDLADAVPAVPNWSMTAIPRAIDPKHVRAVLDGCDRSSACGRRDYAVLMLLSGLGLRGAEVAALTLDDIDWPQATLSVRGKGRALTTVLPMSVDVGTALSDYFRQGRPRCATRTVFLRTRAPVRALASATSVASIVNSAITRADVPARTRGTHQFRHALAVAMLRGGATLTEIGGILRHRHPKTTGIYTKVDLQTLRPLSSPWPGAER